MKIKKIEVWKCTNCGELYPSEDEAAFCCPPENDDGWECGECGSVFEYEDDAKECCK